MAALPYFDEIDPSTIDVLLVTQYASLYFKAFLHYKISVHGLPIVFMFVMH